jgi:hypothetical protein
MSAYFLKLFHPTVVKALVYCGILPAPKREPPRPATCRGPRWRYSASNRKGVVVNSDEEEAALQDGPWFNNPALVNVEPPIEPTK